jgi:DNA-binding LacI/PurR family transcriptional regulator
MPRKTPKLNESKETAPTGGPKSTAVRVADIARVAGLSTGAVSSFFNNRIYGVDAQGVIGVSEKSRERILQACRELNYRPTDPALLSRIYPEEGEVVFLLNDSVIEGFYNRFFSLILDGVEQASAGCGLKLSLGRYSSNVDYLEQPQLLPVSAVDEAARRYIIAGDVNYSLLLYLRKRGAWIAYVNREIDMEGVISIVPDYLAAARTGVTALIEADRGPVAVVAEAYFRGEGYHNRELAKGCVQAFRKHGVPFKASDIIYKEQAGDGNIDSLIRDLSAKQPFPRGIFCFDDWTAQCVYKALGVLGYQIPGDVSVVGCNDDRNASYLNPPLTTIHMPAREIGHRCVEELNRCALGKRGGDLSGKIVFPIRLVERGSVTAHVSA